MASRTPPRFVPTLTEVVQTTSPAPLTPGTAPAPPLSAEQVTRRVLQRVDAVLERRLRETVATVVLEQTSALAPVLRERVEALVHEIVSEALAEELQARQRGTPGGV